MAAKKKKNQRRWRFDYGKAKWVDREDSAIEKPITKTGPVTDQKIMWAYVKLYDKHLNRETDRASRYQRDMIKLYYPQLTATQLTKAIKRINDKLAAEGKQLPEFRQKPPKPKKPLSEAQLRAIDTTELDSKLSKHLRSDSD